jgi:hypothetical protein
LIVKYQHHLIWIPILPGDSLIKDWIIMSIFKLNHFVSNLTRFF